MVFEDGQSNDVIQVYPRPSLVAMATKIGYNSACVRDICKIFAFIGGFGDGPANAANLLRLTLVAMGTKFKTKWAITRHNVQNISQIRASNKGC